MLLQAPRELVCHSGTAGLTHDKALQSSAQPSPALASQDCVPFFFIFSALPCLSSHSSTWPSQATDFHLLIPATHPRQGAKVKVGTSRYWKPGWGGGYKISRMDLRRQLSCLYSAPTQEEAHRTFPNWKTYHQTTLPM